MSTLIISMAPMALFSVIGFWQKNSIMFLLAAGCALALGFSWYDVDGTTRGLGISLMIWAYSTVCLAFALICMFKKDPADQ